MCSRVLARLTNVSGTYKDMLTHQHVGAAYMNTGMYSKARQHLRLALDVFVTQLGTDNDEFVSASQYLDSLQGSSRQSRMG